MSAANFPIRSPGRLANSLKLVKLSASEYHSDVGVQSCSQLKAMLNSPAHYQLQFTERSGSTESMAFGSLVHTLLLEPNLLPFEYAVYPGKRDGRDAAVKEFARQHSGKFVLDEVELQQARLVADRVLHRRIRIGTQDTGRSFGQFLEEAEREVTIYFDDPTTGVRCRTRLDIRHPEVLFDLKTAVDVGRVPWLRSALRLHYDMQAYMYSLADCLHEGRERPLPFIFLAAANELPYSVSVFTAGETFMKEGALKYARALGAYQACTQVELWPDQGEDAVLELDPWQARASEEPGWRRQLEAA